MKKYDVIIVGGGASGMMCAIAAKEKNPNHNIAIIEKQDRIGRKLLSTGNGRCNLLNLNVDKSKYDGSFRKYIDLLIDKNCPVDMLDYFSSHGLSAKEETEGRVYPVSNHASSVLDVLRFNIENLGIETICGEAVSDIRKNGKFFEIKTNNNVFSAQKVVVSTGTQASSKLGGDNSGLNILKNIGIKTAPSYPALCPVKVKSNLLPSLKGLRVKGEVSLYDGKSLVDKESGEIQFTENALSGICVFNLSNKLNKVRKPVLKINLLPFTDDVYALIKRNSVIFSRQTAENMFTGILQKKLALAVLKQAQIKPSASINSLTQSDYIRLCEILTAWNFEVSGNGGYEKAQVAGGGVLGEEIIPETMESRKIKNLYICGEALDIIGKCGGYNLYFAFASGKTVGESL